MEENVIHQKIFQDLLILFNQKLLFIKNLITKKINLDNINEGIDLMKKEVQQGE